jgi:uncharacterized protein (DUF2164 family)
MLNIRLPKEQKDMLTEDIKQFFLTERSEELGDLAAETILDFMLKTVGPHAYNQALADARSLLVQLAGAAEDELYALEKPLR